jgi:hypothetical protein
MAAALIGGAGNPVTGRNELNIISESWELKTGKQHCLPTRQSQVGDYRVQHKQLSLGGQISAQNRRRINSGVAANASLYPPQVTVIAIQLVAN